MAGTTLDPAALAVAHAEGAAAAGRSRFVDPAVAAAARRALSRRGEHWAQTVLGRDLTRRSLAYPTLPFLQDGELETLVLADHAETRRTGTA